MEAPNDIITEELNERFAVPPNTLNPAVIAELQSIMRIHDIKTEELSYKWDAYCLKMAVEDAKMDLKTVRDFKKDLQENAGRQNFRQEKRMVGATPRTGMKSADVFGMLDGIVPSTPAFATPSAKPRNTPRPDILSSSPIPTPSAPSLAASGTFQETLNPQITFPEPTDNPPMESRIKLKSNTDMPKFGYKTMSMKLSDVAEVLDDRIDAFVELVLKSLPDELKEEGIGNPAAQNPAEIIAVGRIASDVPEGGAAKLNSKSVVLETSRKKGAAARVPLKLDGVQNYSLFPGKIVALRGTNASGEFFTVKEILDLPELLDVDSSIDAIEAINSRLEESGPRPLTALIACGPYTTETDLDFARFHSLLSIARDNQVDSLILLGPFIDVMHPLIRTGDITLPPDYAISPDRLTLTDVFKAHIAQPLTQLAQLLPHINILLCPSIRDAASNHASWPQDRFVKKELGLPCQASCLPNPMLISMNELLVGMSNQDVLRELRSFELVRGKPGHGNLLERLCGHLIEQRHFFPLFPAADRELEKGADEEDGEAFGTLGASMDLGYLKLAEWGEVKPDLLITPSTLPPFAKVVKGVVAVNPGTLAKQRGSGTFARVTILPREIRDEERGNERIDHRLYERCRIDIVRI